MVIDIDEEDWKDINDIHFIREDLKFKIGKVIMKGTPLPEHHGDLIDRDKLRRTIVKDPRRALSLVDLADFVWLAPTIIEGSDAE